MLDMASCLRVNGSLDGGGREQGRWFTLPSRSSKIRNSTGYGPAILSGGMRDWEFDDRESSVRAVRVGGICLY
jgi:hypothetical protein